MTNRIYTLVTEHATDPGQSFETVKTEAEIRKGWFRKGITEALIDEDFVSLVLVNGTTTYTFTVSE